MLELPHDGNLREKLVSENGNYQQGYFELDLKDARPTASFMRAYRKRKNEHFFVDIQQPYTLVLSKVCAWSYIVLGTDTNCIELELNNGTSIQAILTTSEWTSLVSALRK